MALLVLLGIGGLVPAAHSQPTTGKFLRGLELQQRGDVTWVRIRFGGPVRTLRHHPTDEGEWLRVELEPLDSRPGGLLPRDRQEMLRPPPGSSTPFGEVVYDRLAVGRAELELRFLEPVRFDVRPGGDLRSLVVGLQPLQPAALPASEPEPETDARTAVSPAESATQRRTPEASSPAAAHVPLDSLLPETQRVRAPVARVEPRAPEAREPAPAPRPKLGGLSGGTADTEAMGDRLVAQARVALQSDELDKAVLLLDEAMSLPEHRRSAEAVELLGVTRERRGQLAHARAAYESYLERWPDQDGSERVQQRLDALLTARAEPTQPLREARSAPRRSGPALDLFGSVYTAYSRAERDTEAAGNLVFDDSFFNDVFVAGHLRTDRVDLRSEFQGSALFDLTDQRDHDWRVNSLFLEAEPHGLPVSGAFGRLPGNRSGVLGRYDGLRVRGELGHGLALSGVAGFPFEPFIEDGLDPSRVFTGLSLEVAGHGLEGLKVELYGIQQWADGQTDRSAIGTEFSWVSGGRFLAGLVDFDVGFRELNTAFLVGTWQLSPSTTLNGMLDYRYLPTLTRRSALLGQPESSLDSLSRRLSGDDVDELALDRTVRSSSATLGITQRLGERWRIAGDLSFTEFSGTPASGGVGEFPGTGLQVDTYVQLIASDLLRRGDATTLGVRHLASRDLDLTSVEMHWRASFGPRLRVDPFFRVEYREATTSFWQWQPGLRLDYRLGAFTLDGEVRYAWSDGERFLGEGDEQGYSLLLGARWDF